MPGIGNAKTNRSFCGPQVGPVAGAAVTTTYGYDNIYQLLSATKGGSTSEAYTYDPVGNRLTSLAVPSFSYNPSNELASTSSATYGYDLNGNAATKNDSTGSTTYNWDFENRLSSVVLPGSGGTVTFKYDPFGRRIYKSSTNGTSVFAHDGDNLVEETNGSGTVVARYSQGLNIDEPLAMLRGSATSYYQADGLGSITSLTNSSGASAQTYTYDSFGNRTASSGSLTNPFQYTGRESDTETNLYYYRTRYYDPFEGRFVSEDAMGLSADLNFYRYVDNSPLIFNDPYGLYKNTGKPADPLKSSIVCDGKGGIRVHLNELFPKVPLVEECLGPCTQIHEESHRRDALAQNPKICRGSADGIQIGFSNNKEQGASELAAYRLDLKCMREQEKRAKCDKCTKLINQLIKAINTDPIYGIPRWLQELSPNTPKVNY